MSFALEATGITKTFPGVLANDHVHFALEQGEIHALLGENGAGKSTLMNILYGLYQPDAGEIRINGQPAKITSPHDAIGKGIGMVVVRTLVGVWDLVTFPIPAPDEYNSILKPDYPWGYFTGEGEVTVPATTAAPAR